MLGYKSPRHEIGDLVRIRSDESVYASAEDYIKDYVDSERKSFFAWRGRIAKVIGYSIWDVERVRPLRVLQIQDLEDPTVTGWTDTYEVSSYTPPDPGLEEEFSALVAEYQPRIEAELEIAKEALKKAESLSEESGLYFYSKVIPWKGWFCGEGYKPVSFKKFASLNEEFLQETLGIVPQKTGWQNSTSNC